MAVTAAQRKKEELERRDAEIVVARMRSIPWRDIANTYGITIRRCKQILQAWRERNPGLRVTGVADPLLVIDELLEGYQGDLEELALAAARATSTMETIAAVKARAEMRGRIVELLQACGVLPQELGRLHVEVDHRFVAETIYRIMTEDGVSQDTIKKLSNALRPQISARLDTGSGQAQAALAEQN